MYQDVIMAGFGGQGVLVAGKLLACAGMLEGKQVTWFPSYGAEMRGGTANCTVIVSDAEIGSPLVKTPLSMLIFNQASFEKFSSRVREKGLLFLNTSLVREPSGPAGVETICIKASDIADELGDVRTTNMVLLGAFVKKTGMVTLESVFAALAEIISLRLQPLIPLNQKALKRGFDLCCT